MSILSDKDDYIRESCRDDWQIEESFKENERKKEYESEEDDENQNA
jgi:hypothetical protein